MASKENIIRIDPEPIQDSADWTPEQMADEFLMAIRTEEITAKEAVLCYVDNDNKYHYYVAGCKYHDAIAMNAVVNHMLIDAMKG